MKANRPVILGIFIVIGLATFTVAVFTLGGQKKSFVKTFTISALFDDVSGLEGGNNIWFSGVKVGTVKKVSLFNTSQVLVTMNIEKSQQSHIRKDAMVKIGSDGLIGNKIVIIVGGTAGAPQVEQGDFLQIKNAFGTTELMDTLRESSKNLLDITKNFKSISKKINEGFGTAATLINDTAVANNFKMAVTDLRLAILNFKSASQQSKNVLGNIQSFSEKLSRQGTLLNELVTDTVVFSSISNSADKLKETVNNTSSFTNKLNEASKALLQKDNTAGMILHDSTLAASFKNTVKNLEAAGQKLDEDLEALQHNFLLRGFFRKKAKQAAKLKKEQE